MSSNVEMLIDVIRDSLKISKYQAVCDLIKIFNDYEINQHKLSFYDIKKLANPITINGIEADTAAYVIVDNSWDTTFNGIEIKNHRYIGNYSGNLVTFNYERIDISAIKPSKTILKITDITGGSDILDNLRKGFSIDIDIDDIDIIDYDSSTKLTTIVISPYSVIYSGHIELLCEYDEKGEDDIVPTPPPNPPSNGGDELLFNIFSDLWGDIQSWMVGYIQDHPDEQPTFDQVLEYILNFQNEKDYKLGIDYTIKDLGEYPVDEDTLLPLPLPLTTEIKIIPTNKNKYKEQIVTFNKNLGPNDSSIESMILRVHPNDGSHFDGPILHSFETDYGYNGILESLDKGTRIKINKSDIERMEVNVKQKKIKIHIRNKAYMKEPVIIHTNHYFVFENSRISSEADYRVTSDDNDIRVTG